MDGPCGRWRQIFGGEMFFFICVFFKVYLRRIKDSVVVVGGWSPWQMAALPDCQLSSLPPLRPASQLCSLHCTLHCTVVCFRVVVQVHCVLLCNCTLPKKVINNYFPKKINKDILDPNFFDPKHIRGTWPQKPYFE